MTDTLYHLEWGSDITCGKPLITRKLNKGTTVAAKHECWNLELLKTKSYLDNLLHGLCLYSPGEVSLIHKNRWQMVLQTEKNNITLW